LGTKQKDTSSFRMEAVQLNEFEISTILKDSIYNMKKLKKKLRYEERIIVRIGHHNVQYKFRYIENLIIRIKENVLNEYEMLKTYFDYITDRRLLTEKNLIKNELIVTFDSVLGRMQENVIIRDKNTLDSEILFSEVLLDDIIHYLNELYNLFELVMIQR
jgi:hypothetical protein